MLVLALCYLLSVPVPYASGVTQTATQTLTATFSPIGKVQVTPSVTMIDRKSVV